MASYKVFKPTEKIKKLNQAGTINPPKFMPSFYEWLHANGAYITFSSDNADTAATYIVPEGYYFFLCYLNISSYVVNLNGNQFVYVTVGDGATAEVIFTQVLTVGNPNAISKDSTVQFNPPLPIPEKKEIWSENNSTKTFINGYGFLVPKAIIPQI